MTAFVGLPSEHRKRHGVHSRLAAVVLVLALTVIVSLIVTTGALGQSPQKNKMLARPSIVNSSDHAANPPATNGPGCVARVIILLDRSRSMIRSGSDQMRDVLQLKSVVKQFLTSIHNKLKDQPGAIVNVSIFAFGTLSIDQGGSDLNIASTDNNKADLKALKTIVGTTNAGSDGKDGIWFTNNDVSFPYLNAPLGLPSDALRGYQSGWVGPLLNNFGTTNYHEAFIQAGRKIKDHVGPTYDPNIPAGDNDYDLVMMITDGFPTTNSGSDNVVTYGEPGVVPTNGGYSTQDEDLNYAQRSVNSLRRGTRFPVGSAWTDTEKVRPPVSVVGILTGDQDDDTNGYMNRVFGSNEPGNKKWYRATNFSHLLSAKIAEATTGLGATCGTTPPIDVVPAISIDAVTTTPLITEGVTGNVNVTVTNLTNSDLINVYIDGPNGYHNTLEEFSQGESQTVLVPIPSSFGSPSPLTANFTVHGEVVIYPETQRCGLPGWVVGQLCPTPVQSDDASIFLTRVPLPG